MGGVALAGAAAVAVRKLWRGVRPTADGSEAPDSRAADLRRKLEESRGILAEREEFESAETPVDRAEAAGVDVEARRRLVHERGREAVDEMSRPEEP